MHLVEDLHRLDEGMVFIPECETEEMLTDCFSLSLQRSFDGPMINYEIVKDYVGRTEDDPVEVYRILKMMLTELIG